MNYYVILLYQIGVLAAVRDGLISKEKNGLRSVSVNDNLTERAFQHLPVVSCS